MGRSPMAPPKGASELPIKFLRRALDVCETEVFTRMPDHLRRTGVRPDWADVNRGDQPPNSFLEGPVFDTPVTRT